jgi:predicted nucleic acid-binding protein
VILVDTSVWVDYLRGARASPAVALRTGAQLVHKDADFDAIAAVARLDAVSLLPGAGDR